MKIGISHRLFLAILAAAALSVTAMFGIMQWSIDRGFLRYVNNLEQMQLNLIADELEADYAQEGSWDFVRNDRGYWRRLLMTTMPTLECPPQGPPPPSQNPILGQDCAIDRHHGSPSMQESRHFVMRLLVRDTLKNTLIGPNLIPPQTILLPLHFQGKTIGHLGLLPLADLTETQELRFLKEQKLTLGLVALTVVLVAAALAFPLAGRLVRPIKTLTLAARKMAAGEFTTRVEVTSSDELGQLAQDFNLLALTLDKNEKTRRQWVADISHELRTPLAVLRAEIEALQDGVRPTTQDSIRSLHGEVLRLNRLVDDLYQLSLSDLGGLTYRKEPVNLADIVHDALSVYRFKFNDKGITLTPLPSINQKIRVFGDPERLQQLFANLLDNSVKYTDSGGSLAISLTQQDGKAVIDFQDSAPGVSESKLDRLFERLYRVESSRNRKEGGAGLGLAICKNIVEGHAGAITAQPSPLGGVWIRITLPLGGFS
ncbi:MAG: HAMP domain-containing protein [Proteobacteria bacterium]|nr:HAMP domain-containing protein [Desulfobulbaceae bacterium]MBU4152051.1 HAMP domain-containing protein [Pseudomonadota bacterium]